MFQRVQFHIRPRGGRATFKEQASKRLIFTDLSLVAHIVAKSMDIQTDVSLQQ
uniref:Uncharacterized protein n=1 Tax=Peronospora matthiolae TaxID=2874970 RepID=A0AAV1U3L0_9STRA